MPAHMPANQIVLTVLGIYEWNFQNNLIALCTNYSILFLCILCVEIYVKVYCNWIE